MTLFISYFSCPLLSAEEVLIDDNSDENRDNSQKLVIWGESKQLKNTDIASPTSVLTAEDMVSINATTTEDLVKYEPSLVIRKRFIGDSNGTLGIRGSNMFQTSRSMVFADGVPLHYFLQTRWSGAPRWSLVSADEIAQVEVVYGPYSAEYGGNAMGGVVKIETAIPTERRIHLEGTFFSHDYQESGFDDQLNGSKQFLSYSDKFDDFTVYLSYNHLSNDGHPQTFRFALPTVDAPDEDDTEVQGGISSVNEYGEAAIYFGDIGIAQSETDNFKIKLGYEFDDWLVLLNIAYEDRNNKSNQSNNYLTDLNGAPIWDGSVVQNGNVFSIRESNFAESELDRRSLLFGFRLQGELNQDWNLEANLSSFKVLEDQLRESEANRQSPAYNSTGEIREYDDTGWSTAKVDIQNDRFLGNDSLSFVTGLNYEHYDLEINNYNSDNYLAGVKTSLKGTSGGSTSLTAYFAQVTWQINSDWDTVIGGRQESWRSEDGFFGNGEVVDQHIDRKESRFSPKFSLGYKLGSDWHSRYSVAKAFRFPIVEELFQNERRTQGTSLANANLEPEDGFHHNLMLQRDVENGYFRINYFYEEIDDVIFAQTTVVNNASIRTFIPIDTVETEGVEFVYNQFGLFDNLLDLRFNTTYTDSTITRNSAAVELEGKRFPRMPEWRANLIATVHVTDAWNIGGGIRYASNSFGDLDNRDTASNVFGAHDGYLFVNLKTNYQINESTKISLGIDNVTNETAFVHHPWPLRTVYFNVAFDL